MRIRLLLRVGDARNRDGIWATPSLQPCLNRSTFFAHVRPFGFMSKFQPRYKRGHRPRCCTVPKLLRLTGVCCFSKSVPSGLGRHGKRPKRGLRNHKASWRERISSSLF